MFLSAPRWHEGWTTVWAQRAPVGVECEAGTAGRSTWGRTVGRVPVAGQYNLFFFKDLANIFFYPFVFHGIIFSSNLRIYHSSITKLINTSFVCWGSKFSNVPFLFYRLIELLGTSHYTSRCWKSVLWSHIPGVSSPRATWSLGWLWTWSNTKSQI